MAIDYLKAEKAFNKYVKSYDISEEYIYLKYDHTLKVDNLMGELAHMLKLSNDYITLAKIIGLLHDIGRFEQITKYKDWYYSTGRKLFPVAKDIDEALVLKPSILQREILIKMQNDLIESFPVDLWK